MNSKAPIQLSDQGSGCKAGAWGSVDLDCSQAPYNDHHQQQQHTYLQQRCNSRQWAESVCQEGAQHRAVLGALVSSQAALERCAQQRISTLWSLQSQQVIQQACWSIQNARGLRMQACMPSSSAPSEEYFQAYACTTSPVAAMQSPILA